MDQVEGLERLHLPAVVVDASARVVVANSRLERVLGLPRGLLIGRDFHAIYRDPTDRAMVDFILNHAVGSEEVTREDEFYLPTQGGGRLPVLISASNLPGHGGERLVTFVDITRIKEAENSLREHFAYVSQLSDTALEQAIALKRRASDAEAAVSEAKAEAAELKEVSAELKTINQELERRVAQRTAELRQANVDAIYMLAVASEAKDHDTGAHVRRIRGLVEKMSRRLGYSPEEAYDIGLAAVLHDVGKIHVPDAVLNKPGPLDEQERKVMEQHTLWGERILPDRPFFRRARLIARSHHENVDGSGYPDGLAGEKIAIEARIVHVADVYDALTSPRVYKGAWSGEAALEEITGKSGRSFDPAVVDAMREIVADK